MNSFFTRTKPFQPSSTTYRYFFTTFHRTPPENVQVSPLFTQTPPKDNGVNYQACNTHYPKTENQKKYIQSIQDPSKDIVLGVGPKGCGKTLLSCYSGIQGLQNGLYHKIIVTVPLIALDQDEVYLHGRVENKMEHWTKHIFDIFSVFYNKREQEYMIKQGVLEISHTSYMKDRTLDNTFIIADEMQFSSQHQIQMITTMLGQNSKIVITGDITQRNRSSKNGLEYFIEKCNLLPQIRNKTSSCVMESSIPTQNKHLDSVCLVEFNKTDIQKRKIVTTLSEIYEDV